MEIIRDNLLSAKTDFILHGCNCQGVMGSGVAAAIRSNFPDAYKQYMNQYKMFGLKAGQYSVSNKTKPAIVNLLTQEKFGHDGKIYASRFHIDQSFRNFYRTLPRIRGQYSFAFPKIGCGLGGLLWQEDVLPIFENWKKDCPGKYEVYEI